jgi:hypothetical protein
LKWNNISILQGCKSPEIKEKIKESYLHKYGVNNPFKSEVIKQQIKETNILRYGVENPQQNNIIKNNTKNTCLKKYGIDTILKLETTIQKKKKHV